MIGAAIISGTVLLASCGKTTTAKELRIVHQCTDNNDMCEFELTDAVVSRYTNMLGKTIERVESKTPLRDGDIKGVIRWDVPASAELADNSEVQSALGVSCQDDKCTENSNPSAYNLPSGTNIISVSGLVTVDDKEINLATVKPDIVDTGEIENSYIFQTGTLPSGLTLDNLIAELNKDSKKAHGTFSKSGSNLMITCDDGYEWLDGVNVPYGQQINTTHNTGVAGTKWNTTEGKFYDEQADTPWVMNGYLVDATKGETQWQAGCWQVQN